MATEGAMLSHPRLVLLEDWRRYRLLDPWVYTWIGPDGRPRELELPAGYVTDLASVPRCVWWWIAPGDLRQASLPHDLIYGYGGRIPSRHFRLAGLPCTTPWTRRDADRLFARIMRECGVGRAKRRAAYLAVRAAGWSAWGKGGAGSRCLPGPCPRR